MTPTQWAIIVVQGTVVDDQTGTPISGAGLTLWSREEAQLESQMCSGAVYTNASGEFLIAGCKTDCSKTKVFIEASASYYNYEFIQIKCVPEVQTVNFRLVRFPSP